MRSPQTITDNYGQSPELEDLALVVSSTSATAVVELTDELGRTVSVPTTITVTSTAQSIATILATAGVAWSPTYRGMIGIKGVTATIFYNYGGKVTKNPDGTYTGSVTTAPTTGSRSMPASDYASSGWFLFGRAAG